MSRETKKLREAVFARAKGKCECRCGRTLTESAQLDHFFGRAKAKQSEANCWAVANVCHVDKTQNFPSAAFWLKTFAAHAKKHGYQAELERARAKYLVLMAKGFA